MTEESEGKWHVTFEPGTDVEHTQALVRDKDERHDDEPAFL